uniref:Uncharacterized protein n=1 Tax=Oryza sativa subsp. japonica TaxID=39947 RepID=Q6EPD9_ORYSJ|nr:hypothetical protein [Oryza sativa Japonica Group]
MPEVMNKLGSWALDDQNKTPQSLAVSRSAGSPQSLSSLILSKIVVAAQESQPTAPHPLRLLAAGKIDAFSPAYLRPPQAPNPPTSQISKSTAWPPSDALVVMLPHPRACPSFVGS